MNTTIDLTDRINELLPSNLQAADFQTWTGMGLLVSIMVRQGLSHRFKHNATDMAMWECFIEPTEASGKYRSVHLFVSMPPDGDTAIIPSLVAISFLCAHTSVNAEDVVKGHHLIATEFNNGAKVTINED